MHLSTHTTRAVEGGLVEILMVPLDVGPAAVRDALTLLSGDERVRADRFTHARDRRRFTVARAELRRQLGKRIAVPPHTIEFAYGPYGKPGLSGRGLCFSVSHSGDVAAIAFAAGGEVGVDIEALRAVPDAGAIAAQWCSPAEWRAYASLGEHQKLRGFLDWWTRKEALVKAEGVGLAGPLAASGGWVLRSFHAGPGLVGAVAFTPDSRNGEGEILVERD